MNENTHRPRAVSALAAAAIVAALAVAGIAGGAAATAQPAVSGSRIGTLSMADMQHDGMSPTSKQISLYTGMAHLWGQHMEWTYATVVAFAQNSPALQASLSRLLQNQTDIGDAIEPFYGATAASRLTALLKVHIEDAVPVLTAAKAGDDAALQTALNAWYANAKDIADFLAAANPHWKKADMEQMMQTHITQTVAYAGDLLAGDYPKAIADYGLAEQHMDEMADMLSAGLILQFPQAFR